LLQCTYDLPIPLTHTTWNSTPPSYEMYLKQQVINPVEMYAWLPHFLITRGCPLLVIASTCSWQRKISWCRLIRSSSARVTRRRFFVSSGTSFRAGICVHGVRAVSYTLVMWLPVLTPGVPAETGPQGCPTEGPCMSEWGSCHPEEYFGYGRSYAGGTSSAPLRGVFRW